MGHFTDCPRKISTSTYRSFTLGQYRIILSADTASEVRQLLSQKRRSYGIPDPVSDYERQKYPTLQKYIAAEIIPEMQKKMRQGFGRAIRTEQDSCVVAILDERAAPGAKYHNAALAALPNCQSTSKIEDVQQFIREQKRPDYFL